MYLVEISASVGALRLSRYREIGGVLGERAVLLQLPLDSIPARTSVGFAPDGYLYVGLLCVGWSRHAGFDQGRSIPCSRDGRRVTGAGGRGRLSVREHSGSKTNRARVGRRRRNAVAADAASGRRLCREQARRTAVGRAPAGFCVHSSGDADRRRQAPARPLTSLVRRETCGCSPVTRWDGRCARDFAYSTTCGRCGTR